MWAADGSKIRTLLGGIIGTYNDYEITIPEEVDYITVTSKNDVPPKLTKNLDHYTASTKVITEAVTKLYDEIINKNLLVRRINITANKLIKETDVKDENFIIHQKSIQE